MLTWFKRKKLDQLSQETLAYLRSNYKKVPVVPKKDINISNLPPKEDGSDTHNSHTPRRDDVRYSLPTSMFDKYDPNKISRVLDNEDPDSAKEKLGGLTDQTFVKKMLEIIYQKNLRDPDVYKAAQIDRRLYSKIISNYSYTPSKDTCLALCFALRLNLEETKDLISRAGYTLSHSSKRDIILEHLFTKGLHDVLEVDYILYNFGELPLSFKNYKL